MVLFSLSQTYAALHTFATNTYKKSNKTFYVQGWRWNFCTSDVQHFSFPDSICSDKFKILKHIHEKI